LRKRGKGRQLSTVGQLTSRRIRAGGSAQGRRVRPGRLARSRAGPGTPDGDRLDVLATLIDRYESEHHAIDPPDPIDAILFRMEQQGLTRKDLEGVIGTRTRVAEVLNRRRGLSINMIRRVHAKLGISADVLIRLRPPQVPRRARPKAARGRVRAT
jgi:HTH-type transcriptional regulator/antitoxin HigA